MTPFPKVDLSAWRTVVERDLKGKPSDELTSWAEGLEIKPLYTAADAPQGAVAVHGEAGWTVAAGHHDRDPQVAREQIERDLAGGVEEVDEVHRGADPVGVAARCGEQVSFGDLAETIRASGDGASGLRAICVDTAVYHDAGCTEVEDLGFAMSTAVATLRGLEETGLSLDAIWPQMAFRFSVGRDVYANVAKLRAARLLWARIVEVAGGPESPAPIHAVTAARTVTRGDPHTNLLRGTLSCFAAIVGGADRITVAPFDCALGTTSRLARRLARNTQLILRDESHLGQIADPAGGSYFFEALTAQMAARAWALLQEIEREGGMTVALASGSVARRVAVSREERLRRLATRRDPVTGVSTFPSAVGPPQGPSPAAVAGDAPFPPLRFGERFDAFRERPHPPQVFLACIGSLSEHTARSTWISNLLAAGGINAPVPLGYETPAAAASALSEDGAAVAIVCSSDGRYADVVETLAPALKRAGASRVVLAGNPREHREAWIAAGVDTFLHVGVDVLAFFESIWEVKP